MLSVKTIKNIILFFLDIQANILLGYPKVVGYSKASGFFL